MCGLATWLLWLSLRFAADLRAAQNATQSFVFPECGFADDAARKAIDDCKRRLRWQANPNPEWLQPLVDEIPRLVREIAAHYHPGHPEPLLAPGLSQFASAVQLLAMDITEFLQTRSIGRLIDVSASTALKTWEMGQKVVTSDNMKRVNKWYRRVLPVWQVVRYKSPVMWVSMAASNIAARTLQPAIVDLVARRAVDLYSGRLARSMREEGGPPSKALPAPKGGEPADLKPEPKGGKTG